MSGIFNSNLGGSNSSLSDATGRAFASSFSAQSANAPSFHHSGGMQGLHHNMQGNFVPNIPGSVASRNSTMTAVPSSGLQQPGSSISSGRFSSNNLPIAMSQISHGLSGITERGGISVAGNPGFSSNINGVGGSIPGFSSGAPAGNHNAIPGMGVNPILGNLGSRMSSSAGNISAGVNIGRSINSGGPAISSLASRASLAANSGSGTLNLQGANRLMGGMLQQAPQMMGMLRNSYNMSGGPISRQLQGGNSLLSSMGMLNDANSNEGSPFDINDFPQLTGRPSSAGGPQGQLGSLRKQGIGVSSIVQQNQEFSIQNEDFPALPGYKGGNSEFAMDLHQKEQPHENVSVMQSQNFAIGGSTGFSHGVAYPSNRQQHQQHSTPVSTSGGVSLAAGSNQDLLHLYGSDLFPSSHGAYQSQVQNTPSLGLRALSSQNPASGGGPYDQLIQQYQHSHNQSQLRLQQMSAINQSYKDHSLKSMQGTQMSERFGLLGLLSVIRVNDPNLTSLAMGMDLTTLGLNLLSPPGDLHKKFNSPWSDEPAKGESEYCIPTCYNSKPHPTLKQGHFEKFNDGTLFYIFYSMPKDEAQLFAAYELYSRRWVYHRELQLWLRRIGEPLVKTQTYERGSYHYFDPSTWQTIRKDNFVLTYEALEKKPILPQH
ncbi:probable NOT transcription complex subunit VIP2 isoform X1 [Dendrobium catenatum]|uniref:probable NOT transcription complex subunit VIP2 isoform X1 n=1 Tax=Dendrobium catenatum TaxID=906689 RepID=UPI00109F9538|nr:probable NOT transcription complex subunit VIP2 isoform X1 [Dendrobium catenatum]XP_020695526.2 probable NOT transcription complex subunit VIP2 isoform X1 [Dendrobium catenatum]XP_020695527.2 probable NOT transcription complex subunit VIP2 isoform X1 [Dendrobium catenatum]XP_028547806.1 probable NOT transcription complex subunit VIP2 isoform X1 [Dendrobium catenatum]XP_028547807.1 probable NOT transcription complex subunit VIP2 isoform X1 [Dendrobium catenatum]XP_028547808.1 probable NOT tr